MCSYNPCLNATYSTWILLAESEVYNKQQNEELNCLIEYVTQEKDN